ncbi:MAG: transporter substrate-binding domain-containing protein [Oculatellaceae cyanobacterium Prado106]|nr:transporter substrate-binding domain-containing protein [Oculatellaceae cyanobacterium Prado106]
MNIKGFFPALGQLIRRIHLTEWLSVPGLFLLSLILPSPDPAQAADLAEIQRRGQLIVGVKENLRPLGFRDEAGQLQGLEIDLAKRIAEEIFGTADAVSLQPLSNDDRIPALLEDRVDIVIARLTATPSRARLVDFSAPYYLDGTTFVTQNDSIQTLRDLQQQPIAVLNNSSTIATVRSLLPQAQLIGTDSYIAAKRLLDAGQATAFTADATVLTGWVQEYPQYRLLPNLISAEPLAVAMPRGLQYENLRQQVETAIADWYTQGTLQQRILYWGLPEAGVPRAGVFGASEAVPMVVP